MQIKRKILGKEKEERKENRKRKQTNLSLGKMLEKFKCKCSSSICIYGIWRIRGRQRE